MKDASDIGILPRLVHFLHWGLRVEWGTCRKCRRFGDEATWK